MFLKKSVNLLHSTNDQNRKNQIIDLNVPEISISNKRQNFAQLNSALTAYSQRHLKRVNNQIMQLSLLDSL